jgi:DNA-binding transcriptional regulator YhcF (GntR family)
MAQPQVAGALVLERLREHILSGIFLGRWRAGDRLPSVREVARRERVDRKTVAAAYRILETEGLVHIRPRSGIYLRKARSAAPAGALERLHRKWLEHAYNGAHALGFGTGRMLELIRALSEAEREPVPVIECNASQADAIAAELRERAWRRHVLDSLGPTYGILTGNPLPVREGDTGDCRPCLTSRSFENSPT